VAARLDTLTPREWQVLRGLSLRRRAKEIARDLDISENTVRGYASDARQKLGLPSIRDAVALFLELDGSETPPQFRGDRIQRVAEHPPGGAALDRGLPGALLDTQEQAPGDFKGAANDAGPRMSGVGRVNRMRRLHGWLGRLTSARWLGLTMLVTLGVITAFGLAAVTVLGIFEVLQQVGGGHR